MRNVLSNHSGCCNGEKNSILIIKSRKKIYFKLKSYFIRSRLPSNSVFFMFAILENTLIFQRVDLRYYARVLDMSHSGHESVATFSDGFLAILVVHDGCSGVFYFSTRIPASLAAQRSRSGTARWDSPMTLRICRVAPVPRSDWDNVHLRERKWLSVVVRLCASPHLAVCNFSF